MGCKVPIKLNVGCGLDVAPGYQNLDNSHSVYIQNNWWLRPAVHFLERLLRRRLYTRFPQGVSWYDVTRGLPFESQSVDVVHSSHMLEHLSRQDAEAFLREVHRVLVAGGVVRLAVPDLERKTRHYLERVELVRANSLPVFPADEFMRSTLLGMERGRSVSHPQDIYRALFSREGHAWMWDAPSLMGLLGEIGFRQARERDFGESLISEITLLDVESRREESIYIEAEK